MKHQLSSKRWCLLIAFVLIMGLCPAAWAADTDITDFDNVIYAEAFTAEAGSDVELSIQARNTFCLRSYQFTLQLPEGLTVAVDDKGMPLCEISTQRTYTKRMNFSAQVLKNGDLMVLCSSLAGGNYEGQTGEICTVKLHVAQEAEGTLPLRLYQIKACDPSYNAYTMPEVTFSAQIDAVLRGDVNRDGKLSIADITTFIDARNNPSQAAADLFRRADLDGDGTLTETDLEELRQLVLTY